MSLKDNLKEALLKTVEEHSTEKSKERRPMTPEDYDSFMEAAYEREDPLWQEIDNYLSGELGNSWPLRCYKLKREIKWLRKKAAKAGLEWGKL